MLQRLTIINYAIIERLEVIPDGRLNIVTGETGAGKSIIVGALSLILGERADSSVMLNKDEKSVVEGVFDVRRNTYFKQCLEAEGLDIEDECIIRREITAAGKSRAFVNDTPVTLSVLNKLTSLLVDLHRQFDNMAIDDSHFQLEAVDAVGDTLGMVAGYKTFYDQYKSLHRELEQHLGQRAQWQKEADYKQFLLDELVQADIKLNEIEQAEIQLKQISQAERIISILQAGKALLAEGETPLLNELVRYGKQLQGITDLVPSLKPLADRLQSVAEELKDIHYELEQEEEKISLDPEQLEHLQQRLDLGYKLLKKHGLQHTQALIDLREELDTSLQRSHNLTDIIDKLTKELSAIEKRMLDAGQQLTKQRKATIKPFTQSIAALLPLVGMPNAKFKVELANVAPNNTGLDEISFLLDANNSGQFKPLGKAASGGEISRIMLCIKSMTAKALHMPVLIFDEVDTGISGEAARQVGRLLAGLAAYHQVICITHQPQVAARADRHFYVFKEADAKGRLSTRVAVLDADARVQAIARMIGGEQPGATAISHAKELIAEPA